ncbi:MAG: diguanylate cyclase, partial [Devosia sp.]|nr:diguanylate cyclase [Devosia sp.]
AWDVSGRSRAERAMLDQLRFVEQLIETIPSPAFYKDADGRYLGCNRAFEVFCGLKREDLIGKTVFEIWPPDRAPVYQAADEALLKTPGVQIYEAPIRYADGTEHDVIFHRATFEKADGGIGGIVGVFWDVTERKRAEQALRRSEDRFRRIVENAPFGVLVTDGKDDIVFVNRRFGELFHYLPEQIATLEAWRTHAYPQPDYQAEVSAQRGLDLEQLRSGEVASLPARETHVTCGDGVVRDIETAITVEDDMVYSVFNDVTERNRAEQALRDVLQAEALHDPLTTLFNRRYLDQVMEREFSRAVRSGEPVSVIMGDIDHFKLVNDKFGHDCGDQVLQAIARQLASHIRKGDIACRYGGEEFTLLLPNTSLEIACERAERLCAVIRDVSVSSNGQPIGQVTISFGVAAYPQHGDTPDKVLKAADEALLRAKREGRDRVASAYQFLAVG